MKQRIAFIIPLVAFSVLAVFFYFGLQSDARIIPSVLINQDVPPFALDPIKGRTDGFANTDLRGDVSLVNIFGSWCVACRVEHPFLMRLKAQGAVPLHGIDWREVDREAGPAWLARFGDPYTLVGDDPVSKAAIAFGVTGAPETFVVDRSGVIRYKHVGPLSPELWERTLWPLIVSLRQQ
jgi:cytochrome c biogenesis protein CcmG/thiol:disulfide interchange protein DsbE